MGEVPAWGIVALRRDDAEELPGLDDVQFSKAAFVILSDPEIL